MGFKQFVTGVGFKFLGKGLVSCSKIEKVIQDAIVEMDKLNIKGKDTTPFLLAKIVEMTGGDSLEANIKLVYNNCLLASQIAKNL